MTALRRRVVVDAVRAREITRKRAGKTIARAGGIVDVLERIGRRAEEQVVREQQATVFAFLDDHEFRALFQDVSPRLDEVGLFRKLARLAFIEHEAIDLAQQLDQRVALRLDPQVHRVGHDELRPGDLRQHMHLELRRDVGEEHVRRALVASGSVGWNVSKTFRQTDNVRRLLRSHSYSPLQRNVWPSATCKPSRLIPCLRYSSMYFFGKSVPTMATMLTGAKKLAATEA